MLHQRFCQRPAGTRRSGVTLKRTASACTETQEVRLSQSQRGCKHRAAGPDRRQECQPAPPAALDPCISLHGFPCFRAHACSAVSAALLQFSRTFPAEPPAALKLCSSLRQPERFPALLLPPSLRSSSSPSSWYLQPFRGNPLALPPFLPALHLVNTV